MTPFESYASYSNDVDCLIDQLSTREQIATSVLRADLPVSVFGRGIGLAIRLKRPEQVGCAYPFDAWTGRAGSRAPCRQAGGVDRAQRRLLAVRAACRSSPADHLGMERRIAQDAEHTCCHDSIEGALTEQRRFLALSANDTSDCVRHARSLPNQASLSWRASDVVGVFYLLEEARPAAEAALRRVRGLRPNATTALVRLGAGRAGAGVPGEQTGGASSSACICVG
jgi:hypothetical protein